MSPLQGLLIVLEAVVASVLLPRELATPQVQFISEGSR